MNENSDTFDTKLNERGFFIEQINQLDQYFCRKGIGTEGEFKRYLLQNEGILGSDTLMRNIGVVLQYQDDETFDKLVKRLRCGKIEHYCKCILAANDLESFYNTYEASQQSKKNLDYPRDESGAIILEEKDYLIPNIMRTGSCGGRWYLLSNGTEVFIKKVHRIQEAHAELVSEQIAKQMGIPHAQYDLVNLDGKKQVISINMLDEAEELTDAANILTNPREKDIEALCRNLCRLIKGKYPNLQEADIQRLKEDFLKITIFDKVIGNWDRNPENWGVITSSTGDVRMAPVFDHNNALDSRWYYDDRNYNYRDMRLNGSHSLDSLLEYCFSNFSNPDEFLEFVENCVGKIDVKKACQDIQEEKRISIPDEEIMYMDSFVSSRSPRQMSFWLEQKKSVPGEDGRMQ